MRISDWMSGVRSSDLKGSDLVAVCLDVVGRYDDGACRAFQLLRDVGHGGFLVFGIQHAMAFAIQAVAAQLGEAGYAPEVGTHAPVALQHFLRSHDFAQDRAQTGRETGRERVCQYGEMT